MAIKKYYPGPTPSNFPNPGIIDQVRIHQLLSSLDIPTVSLFYYNEEKPDHVYMSDETEGGRFTVFTLKDFWPNPQGRNGKFFSRDTLETGIKEESDKRFYRQIFTVVNAEEVELQVLDIYRTCVDSGISLGDSDVFMIKVDKALNKAQVMIGGDYAFIQKVKPQSCFSITSFAVKYLMERLPLVAKFDPELSSLGLENIHNELREVFEG